MFTNRIAAILLVGACAVVVAHGARADDDEGEPSTGGMRLPEGLQVEWRGTLTQTEDGNAMFTGPVTMIWKETRIQADRMSLREKRYLEAEGNVLLVWGKSRIFGDRMSYDLDTERGVIENAMGQTLDEYLFWAKSAEKIGVDKVRLKSATITTCTQPVPYWSFSVSSATVRIDNYARMWNVRLKAGRAPLIYLPYLIWPIKQDRAPGLLLPELENSQSRGVAYKQKLFLPIGRSADLTLEGRYYSKAGLGGGGRFRAIPNRTGIIDFAGFYINDQVYADQNKGDGDRYQVVYSQEQKFQNGYRMVADVDVVSDPEYLSDYARDLNVASTPQSLARLEFSRNGPWISTNVRELWREQLSSGLVQQALPEIELRGRDRQIGGGPVYFAFEASGASIQQKAETALDEPPFDPDYLRGDFNPTLSLPMSPVPWLDITPQASQRVTYYTQQQTTVDGERIVEDTPLTRSLTSYGLEITGPKVSRIFRPEGPQAARFKHSIEPQVRYGFREKFDDADDVLLYDEVDRVSGSGASVNYALVQRLFAKRPRADTEVGQMLSEQVYLPDGTMVEATPENAVPTDDPGEAPQFDEPVEIASLSLTQTRSFEEDISRADVDGDGEQETSPYSPILLAGRYSPGPGLDLSLRSQYDILFDEVRNVTLSGILQEKIARMRFSLVYDNGLGIDPATGEERDDNTQARLTTGLNLVGGKLHLNIDGSYTANPDEGVSHFPDQRWQIQYATQCCTFFIERLTRDFATSESRREIYFRLDLRGIGKVLSSTWD